MVRAVEAVRPAVVGVVNLQRAGDGMRRQAEMVEAGTGSGVVYEVKGNVAHVVTNNHVIEGASQVEVVCGIGDRAAAKVLGADSLTDLAVLAVDARFVKGVARFGNSDQLVPGQQAIAIGNPLGLDFSQTVTAGVISATNRAIPLDFDGDGEAEWELETIQTDAAINPGNSGGALVNLRGEVVGINSLKISDAGIEGMGFAIPVNDALPIIRQLAEEGQIQRPYLGITPKSLQAIPNQERVNQLRLPQEVISGVVVLRADPPARQAGLKPMDVIVQMDDQSIHSAADLRRYLYTRKRPGETVRISYLRGGELRETVIRLTPMAKLG
jgi:serine protease Do